MTVWGGNVSRKWVGWGIIDGPWNTVMHSYVFTGFKFKKKRPRVWKITRNELGIECRVHLKETPNLKILTSKIKNNCIIKPFVEEEKKRNNDDKFTKTENEFDKVALYRRDILTIYIVHHFCVQYHLLRPLLSIHTKTII